MFAWTSRYCRVQFNLEIRKVGNYHFLKQKSYTCVQKQDDASDDETANNSEDEDPNGEVMDRELMKALSLQARIQ